MNLRFLLLLALLAGLTFSCNDDGQDATATTKTETRTPDKTEAQTPTRNQPGTPGVRPVPAAPQPVSSPSGFVPAGYELVWNDEFNQPGLPDSTRWGYQTGGHGWTAKEMQNYTGKDPETAHVADGFLNITALAATDGRNPVKSARLVTNDKADFETGYFEIRAKFPAGEGLRSAFWMVGDTVSAIGWPDAGEIDVVEHYGRVAGAIGAAVQMRQQFWSDKGGKGQLGKSIVVSDATSAYHVYACEWTEEQLVFSVDGQPFWTYTPERITPRRWPFQWPFYLALNLSAGGNRSAAVGNVRKDIFPATMSVDYVRVYQKK